MIRLYVAGYGFWAPGFASAQAWLRGDEVPALTTPPPSLLPVRTHARASLLTRMSCDALNQAARAAELDLSDMVCVFGSALGEMQRLQELLATPASEPLSPIRFQLSVHNSTAGLASVALGSRAPSTSVAAGADTVAGALWEVAGQLADGGTRVMMVVGDEHPPQQLGARDYLPFAAAFAFESRPTQGGLFLTPPQHAHALTADWTCPSLRALRENPCRGAALLVRALATGVPAAIALAGDAGRALTTRLDREQP